MRILMVLTSHDRLGATITLASPAGAQPPMDPKSDDAPGVLRHVKGADGRPLVFGKRVTSFSNTEEEAVQLTKAVPFLVEDMLIKSGGHYTKQPNWQAHVVTDGPLVFGQNPASSAPAADAVLELIRARR